MFAWTGIYKAKIIDGNDGNIITCILRQNVIIILNELFDTTDNVNKWYKCDKYFDIMTHCKMLNTKNNYIHYINKYCHIKINLFDILPQKYYKDSNKNKKHQKLIFGYITKLERKNENVIIFV